MKAFIACLLVVAVSATQTSHLEKYLLNRLNGYYYNNGMTGFSPVTPFTTTDFYNKGYGYDTAVNTEFGYDTIYTLEQLEQLPIFQEYMSIPLFRQYFSVPSFRIYVQSRFFQRYFQYPVFQQFFRTPALFYKYVYPVVQTISQYYTHHQTYNYPSSYYNYPSEYNYNYPSVYSTQQPEYMRYGQRELAVPSYIPTGLNYYRQAFEKVFRDYMVNKDHQVIEVQTDIKVKQPTTVDPITETKYVKDIEGKYVPVIEDKVQKPIENLVEGIFRPSFYGTHRFSNGLFGKYFGNDYVRDYVRKPETVDFPFMKTEEKSELYKLFNKYFPSNYYGLYNKEVSPFDTVKDFEKLEMIKNLIPKETYERFEMERPELNKMLYKVPMTYGKINGEKLPTFPTFNLPTKMMMKDEKKIDDLIL